MKLSILLSNQGFINNISLHYINIDMTNHFYGDNKAGLNRYCKFNVTFFDNIDTLVDALFVSVALQVSSFVPYK